MTSINFVRYDDNNKDKIEELIIAIVYRNIQKIDEILQSNSKLIRCVDSECRSILHWVALIGCQQTIKLFVKYGTIIESYLVDVGSFRYFTDYIHINHYYYLKYNSTIPDELYKTRLGFTLENVGIILVDGVYIQKNIYL